VQFYERFFQYRRIYFDSTIGALYVKYNTSFQEMIDSFIELPVFSPSSNLTKTHCRRWHHRIVYCDERELLQTPNECTQHNRIQYKKTIHPTTATTPIACMIITMLRWFLFWMVRKQTYRVLLSCPTLGPSIHLFPCSYTKSNPILSNAMVYKIIIDLFVCCAHT